jgi:hypothetical protein
MKVVAAITLLFAAVAMAAPAAQPAEDCIGAKSCDYKRAAAPAAQPAEDCIGAKSCDYKRAAAPAEAEKRSGGCPGSQQCYNHQCNTYVCRGLSCGYEPNGQSC